MSLFGKNGRSVSSEIVDKQIIKGTASYARDLEIDLDDEVVYLEACDVCGWHKPIMIEQ